MQHKIIEKKFKLLLSLFHDTNTKCSLNPAPIVVVMSFNLVT